MDDGNNTTRVPSFEQWMAYYNETVAFERKIGIIIPSIFAVIIVVGVVGNLLVVIVALNRAMRNSTNTLIIGMPTSFVICHHSIAQLKADFLMSTQVVLKWSLRDDDNEKTHAK
ncbi:hypothetical protein GCK32_022698 [Trichostrongylus colubriformis]|uniref:G-protein coupled receptors family 1 profile domain-containing protein n=1 Tax=Trichostrongylus colubriformis TaxID=6319 RepID=A0AAN8FLH3_TRICO